MIFIIAAFLRTTDIRGQKNPKNALIFTGTSIDDQKHFYIFQMGSEMMILLDAIILFRIKLCPIFFR